MLTETDDRVLAETNLHAVLGALPRLAELAPDAAPILARLARPTTLTLRVRGGQLARYRFGPAGIEPAARGDGPALLFASPAHLNAVIAGTSRPIPLAGPAGIRFLTDVFTPLTDLLGRYLRPSDADLSDPGFQRISILLTVEVTVRAIAVVGNEDRSGRFSAAHMPDGSIDLEVGEDLRYRIAVRRHRLALEGTPIGAPRAALRFADLDVAGGILAGRESALACICDGRLAMRGFVPLVDNTSRILDRVGDYLGA